MFGGALRNAAFRFHLRIGVRGSNKLCLKNIGVGERKNTQMLLMDEHLCIEVHVIPVNPLFYNRVIAD